MEQISTIHRLLFPDEKKDYFFMCFELMWLVFSQKYNFHSMPIYKNDILTIKDSVSTVFKDYIENEWKCMKLQYRTSFNAERPVYVFLDPLDVPQLMIWYSQQIYKDTDYQFQLPSVTPMLHEFNAYVADFKRVDCMLKIIR